MTTLSYTVPVAGSTLNSIADPEVATALSTILTWANGNIDGTSIAAGAIDGTKLSTTAAQSAAVNQVGQVVKGSVSIATSQSTSSAAFTTLTTPDQVQNVVLPSSGLIAVWYQATWQESIASAATADIFLNSTQMTAYTGGSAPSTNPALIGHAASNAVLSTYWGGLASQQTTGAGGEGYTGNVTTGQAVGGGIKALIVGTGDWTLVGGPCYLFATAGTYTVSVRFATSSGTVTASNRTLWVQALSFA